MKKAALHNLGCKVNSYETEAMQQMLEEDGFVIVPFNEMADVYIINTCSVTNMADAKSRQMIHRARKLNPDAIVVAAGCYVQTSAQDVIDDLAVDIVIGNNKKSHLIPAIHEFMADRQEVDDVIIGDQQLDYEELKVTKTAEHTRAFIKVQDGCNQFCSYCIIPYARGRIRSRGVEDVVEEVKTLAADGYKEVVLTGIHLSSYGMKSYNKEITEEIQAEKQAQETSKQDPKDALKQAFANAASAGDITKEVTKRKKKAAEILAEREAEAASVEAGDITESRLIDLIEAVAKVDGIERIRLGSLEPRLITRDFITRLAAVEKICPHFHLSLQSGCDETLQRMNRKYTAEDFRQGVELIRQYFDHPAITTDVIVGFPGETEEEFEICKKFLEEIRFYEMHIFKYSKRKGTVAEVMPNQVPEQIKHERSKILIALANQMSEEFRQAEIGRQQTGLMEIKETIEGQDYWTGFTKEYVRVAVPAEGRDLSNTMVSGTFARALNAETYLLEES